MIETHKLQVEELRSIIFGKRKKKKQEEPSDNNDDSDTNTPLREIKSLIAWSLVLPTKKPGTNS